MFLNDACFKPFEVISEEFGPYCSDSHAGRAFDLHRLLLYADPYLLEMHPGNPPNTSIPTDAFKNVHLPLVHKIVPFIFYAISGANTSVLIFLIPRSFKGRRRESLLNFSIAAVRLFSICLKCSIFERE
jgi:hypothetical protein